MVGNHKENAKKWISVLSTPCSTFFQADDVASGLLFWVFWSLIATFALRHVEQVIQSHNPVALFAWQLLFATIGTQCIRLFSTGPKKSASNLDWTTYWRYIARTSVTFAIIIVLMAGVELYGYEVPFDFLSAYTALVIAYARSLYRMPTGDRHGLLLLLVGTALAMTTFGGGDQFLELAKSPKSLLQDGVVVQVLLGTLFACFAIVVDSMLFIWLEEAIHSTSTKVDSFTLLSKLAPLCFFLTSLASIVIGERLSWSNFDVDAVLPLVVVGISGAMKLYGMCRLISLTNATSFALANSVMVRFIGLTFCVIDSTATGLLSPIGLILGFVGTVKYFESSTVLQEFELLDSDCEHDEERQTGENLLKSKRDSTSQKQSGWIYIAGSFFISLLVIMSQSKPIIDPQIGVPFHNHGSNNIFSSDSIVLLNMTKVGVMLETRYMPELASLIQVFLNVVPQDWPFVIWCSEENYDSLRLSTFLNKDLLSGRLNLTVLPDFVDVHNAEYLSRFLTKPWFYEQYHTSAEWMLFFQSDAVLCAQSKESIDDWLGYEWVGAPVWWKKENRGGNGGLSMRKISTMLKVTRDTQYVRQDGAEAEDLWFRQAIEKGIPDAKWPERDQELFSINPSILWDDAEERWQPLGVHRGGGTDGGGPLWHNNTMLDRLAKWCPEAKLLH